MASAWTPGSPDGVEGLSRSSPMPLWAQIQTLLTRRLAAGDFIDGFPTEAALQTQYGVSRHTIREALRGLRSSGALLAERGRGTRVVNANHIEQPLGTLYSLFRSVEVTGRQQRSIVRSLGTVRDRAVALRLGLDPAEELLHLARLRLSGGEPLALDSVWLPLASTRPLLSADFGHTALYDELRRLCGIRVSGGHELIHAVRLPPAQRRALQAPAGVSAFRIDRVGHVHGEPFEWRETVVRGDRFAFSATWSAHAEYRLEVAAVD
jgi:GntR family transcriptional regulator